MGLDMYIYVANKNKVELDSNLAVLNKVKPTDELFYWRKHANLHGWFQKLWEKRLGEKVDVDFNCKFVLVTKEDLQQLRTDVNSGALPYTTGYFFGSSATPSDKSEYTLQKNQDLHFIKVATHYLSSNPKKVLLYYSWW